MSTFASLVSVHLAGEGKDEISLDTLPGKFTVTRTDEALTPYGGLAAWSGFLKHLGIIERLADHCPVARTSPNAAPVREGLHSFLLGALVEGKRFCHVRWVMDDPAVATLMGMDRVRGEDALPRLGKGVDRESLRQWMNRPQAELYAALPDRFIADWDATVNTRYGHQEDAAVGYTRSLLTQSESMANGQEQPDLGTFAWQAGVDTTIGAATPAVFGMNGFYSSVEKQILTKMENETIQNIAATTGENIFANQLMTGLPDIGVFSTPAVCAGRQRWTCVMLGILVTNIEMKNTILTGSLIVGACVALFVTPLAAADSPREHLSLDANWKFHLGDDWPDALHLENSGTGGGPASEKFADAYWRAVNLPHDWAVELSFDWAADGSHGFKTLGVKYPTNSIGWYRRAFELPKEDEGKRIWLTFDGVFRDATVWVNGWCVRRHEGGYYPFREDITDVLHFGSKNTVAVRVDATKTEGWFYEGAGIYRHVWLDQTAPVAIAPAGIFVRSEVKEHSADVTAIVDVRNDGTNTAEFTIDQDLLDAAGRHIANAGFKTLVLPAKEARNFSSTLTVPMPELWSPESPRLYKLVTKVRELKIVDQKETTFGIRTVGFDPTNGFLLNGKHYELYGTCNHQDHAGVGAAIPDALQEFRVKKLKEFGCNAIRTSHNPPTPELLDACDRLGMLVLDESRLMGSDSENMKKWDDQIRRDRNHPSVAIWCIANEQFAVQDTPQAANIARTMQDYVKRLDPTRPVTYAAPEDNVFRGINSVIEVRGWNYHYGPQMDQYHAEHPSQPNVGTEQASVVSTRGIYTNDQPHGYVAAYDIVWPGWTTTAESWWSFFATRPWLSGAFVWTGFDYRGEPTPYWWPCVNSHFGILDTCGFPKDVFYYYQSWWTTNTVLHLLPHWNWSGREGQEILVEAFSNCKQVELFLNGVSLGKQAMKPNSKLSWQVKYAPGTLSAKGFDAAGNVVAETKVETTGDATQIQLTPDRKAINADGEDVAVFTVSALDAQGRAVPVAQDKINFTVEGAGKVIGVGNGDPGCHEPDVFVSRVPERSVAVNDWRWQLAKIPHGSSTVPEYANDFDDSTWNNLNAKTSGGEATIKTPDTTAIYRAHFTLTEADLKGAGAQICFGGCDDEGWYFVNGQFVGESHDWQAQPIFDIKKFIHAGDNVIAVGVNNAVGSGGLNSNVTVKIIGNAGVPPWSRSLFNGLAQVIVQSARDAGEIKLTATADSLAPATTVVQTQPCTPRLSVR